MSKQLDETNDEVKNLGKNLTELNSIVCVLQKTMSNVLPTENLSNIISISEKAQKRAEETSSSLLGLGNSIKGILGKIPLFGDSLVKASKIDKINTSMGHRAASAFSKYDKGLINTKGLILSLLKTSKMYFISLAKHLINPISLTLMLLSAAITRFVALDLVAEEFRKTTGLVVSQTADIERIARDINVEYQRYGVTMEGAYKSASAILKTFQVTSAVTKELSTSIALLSQNYGVAEEDSAKMYKTLLGMGKQSAVTARNALAITAHLSALSGVSAPEVFKDIASASSDVLNYVGQSPKKLILATIEARRLGTTIESIVKSARGMINFQESITSEMEASVLLGRNVNMQRARELAWMGKINESREEALRQIQLAGNWDKMNVIQREKLAQAAGMEVAEVNSMFAQKKMIANMDSETRSKYKQFIHDQKLLNKLNEANTTQKAKDFYMDQRREALLTSLKHEVMSLITSVADALEPVIQLVAVIIRFLAVVIGWVGRLLKGFFSFLRPLSDLNTLISKNSTKLNKYIDIIGDVFEFSGKMLGTMMILLVGTIQIISWLIDRVGKLGVAFKWVGDLNESIKKMFATNRITKFFVSMYEVFASTFGRIGKLLSSFSKVIKGFSVIGKIFSGIGSAIGIFARIGAFFFKWIPLIGWIITAIQLVFNIIKRMGKGQGLWESIGGAIYDTLLAPFVDIWNWLTNTFFGNSPSQLGLNILKGISAINGMLFDLMVAPFKMAWNAITSIFSGSNLMKIVNVFKKIFGLLGNVIISPLKSIMSIFGDVTSKIKDTIDVNAQTTTNGQSTATQDSDLVSALNKTVIAISELTSKLSGPVNEKQYKNTSQNDKLDELISLLKAGAISINLDGKKVSTALASVSQT